MTIITTTAELADHCKRWSQAEFITVDTEFMRDNSYYSRLCLIQVGDDDGAWAIDPLANGIELDPFLDVLNHATTLKVFHAARQDVEIFLHLSGEIPKPLFDSQVAAMVCGFGDAVSYEKLAARLAGARLDKSQRFTDWSRRPLTERQVKYALGDVTYLREIHRSLSKTLEQNGRQDWLAEEMEILLSPATYLIDRNKIWRRLKTRSNNRRFLAVVRELAAWREDEAQRRDIPRNRVIRDEAILETAAHPPKSVQDLRKSRSLPRQLRSESGSEGLLKAVSTAMSLPDADLPEAVKRIPAAPGTGPLMQLLKVLLKLKCEEYGVAQKLLASTADLELIAAGDHADVAALRGWRLEVFGKDALALKSGKIALSAQGHKIVLVPAGAS